MDSVCLIFRKPRPLFHSIEKVFALIAANVGDTIAIRKIFLPYHTTSMRNIVRNLLFARKQQADVYHVTGDIHYAVLLLPAKRTMLTIHDCVFMNQNTGIKRWVLQQLFLRWPVKRSAVVTTISEQSKQDIVRYSGCNPDKVIVIPNPVDDRLPFHPKPFNAQVPVLLFIGTSPNKNLTRVIQSVTGLPCILDIVGKISPADAHLLESTGVQFRESFQLSDEEMASKYLAADALLFPSTYEGFGLPIVEANRVGLPVITSNLSPMKEVAADSAVLVDPLSVASIREGTQRVISDPRLREQLVRNGLRNVSKYQPTAIAHHYADLYRSLLNGHRGLSS